MLEPDREVYPNAPLKLVAAEVRYPLAPRLLADAADFLHARLGGLPILEPVQEHTLQVGLGGPGPDIQAGTARFFRLMSRDRTASATITPNRAIVETSRYERYERLRDLVEALVRALEEFKQPALYQRLGLRYIDEIRIPGIDETPGDWRPYIASELLAPMNIGSAYAELTPWQWEAVLRFDRGPQAGLLMRYGSLAGFTVDPTGPLRVKPDGAGPYFLIDIDSFWEGSEVADFKADEVLSCLDHLHEPVRALFERSITDQLRNEVLRKERIGS